VPELPEVERYRELAEHALGRTISSVTSPDLWFLKGAASGPALARSLEGALLASKIRPAPDSQVARPRKSPPVLEECVSLNAT